MKSKARYFNSIKVRLELKNEDLANEAIRHFNSIKVRLERLHDYRDCYQYLISIP